MIKNDNLYTLDRPGLIPGLIFAQFLVILPLLQQVALWISIASVLAILWRLGGYYRHWPLPNKWIRLMLGMAGAAGIILEHKALFTKEAGLSLFVLMTSFRLLELFKYRDGMNSLFLNFFLLSVSFLYSQSILTATYSTLVLLWLLMCLHALQRTDGFQHMKSSFGNTFKILLIALPVTVIMFVFFPRLSHPLWQMPSRSTSGSGVSDSMTPGDISTLTLDNAIAFRVKFHGVTPPLNKMYWRGLVLSHFDGLTWTRVPAQLKGHIETLGPAVNYNILLEPHQHRWLFYLDLPVKGDQTPYIRQKANEQYINELSRKLDDRLMYQGKSYINYRADVNLDERLRKRYLQLPEEGNLRTRKWARELRNSVNTDQQMINHVLQYIHQQKFYYTLSPPILEEEGIDDFWFNTRRGFCEHYASNLTFIARAAGIPARIVIGYQGGEVNPFNDDFLVRQSDAHAWTEIWLPGQGWKRIDPTAAIDPSRVERDAANGYRQRDLMFDGNVLAEWLQDKDLLSQARFLWDAVNSSWQKWIIEFNQQKQQELLNWAGIKDHSWKTLFRIMLALTGIILIIWLIFIIKIPEKKDKLVMLYEKLCHKLAKAGLVKYQNEGPENFLQRINATNSNWGLTSKPIIQTYIKYRYANRLPDEKELKLLYKELENIR